MLVSVRTKTASPNRRDTFLFSSSRCCLAESCRHGKRSHNLSVTCLALRLGLQVGLAVTASPDRRDTFLLSPSR
jgi:hypothetical protein